VDGVWTPVPHDKINNAVAPDPQVRPILKDRRQARGERDRLLHLDAQMSPLAFRA